MRSALVADAVAMSEGPEARLKRQCREWLRAKGAYVFSPVQMGYGATTLDDLVCLQGRFVAIEYKRPDKRPSPTPRQTLTIAQIGLAGGLALLVYDITELQRALHEWGFKDVL